MNPADENKMMRRVAGVHNIRLDGITDLLLRGRDASVMDIGCNRGMVAYEFFLNGATKIHGCDNYERGIQAAQEWFADLRSVKSKFEVVDLSKGVQALAPFDRERYDIVLMLATYHKLKRIMNANALNELMQYFGEHTIKYFGWRGTSEKTKENESEIADLDRIMRGCGLRRIHTSYISMSLGVAAIWARL